MLNFIANVCASDDPVAETHSVNLCSDYNLLHADKIVYKVFIIEGLEFPAFRNDPHDIAFFRAASVGRARPGAQKHLTRSVYIQVAYLGKLDERFGCLSEARSVLDQSVKENSVASPVRHQWLVVIRLWPGRLIEKQYTWSVQ